SAGGSRFALPLASVFAAVALVFVLLATGTNPPAAPVFNAIFALPLGWLLREPTRFLMVAALAYAVLIGVGVQLAPALLARAGQRLAFRRSSDVAGASRQQDSRPGSP